MRTGLFAIVAVFSLLGAPLATAQDVSVAIDIGVPPPISFAAPPDVVVVPSGESYVYMVPNRVGLYFYGGHWYRYHLGHWFRSDIYNGSWGLIDIGLVPSFVLDIPPEYPRFLPRGYHRLHYGDFYRNWNSWDRDRHWHNRDWFRREMRPDVRQQRFSRIERYRGTRSVWPQGTPRIGAVPGPRGPGAGPGPRGPGAGPGPGPRGPGAGPGPRGPGAGPGPGPRGPGAGPGTRGPGAGPAQQGTRNVWPGQGGTPGARTGPRTAPSAGPGPRTAPSAGPGPRTAPGAGPGPRTAPGAGPGPRTAPGAGAGPRRDRKEN